MKFCICKMFNIKHKIDLDLYFYYVYISYVRKISSPFQILIIVFRSFDRLILLYSYDELRSVCMLLGPRVREMFAEVKPNMDGNLYTIQ